VTLKTHPAACWIVLVLIAGASTASAAQTPKQLASQLLEQAGISRGICAVLGTEDGRLALELVRASEFLVHVQDPRPAAVEAARKTVDVDGLWLRRVIVETGPLDRLPFADNTVDLVITTRPVEESARKDILRALRPGGKAIIGSVITKPPLAGADEWTHVAHLPDNNPVSTDTLIKSPFMSQWLGGPYYSAMPVVSVAAGGRLFTAQGHIAHHRREESQLYRLLARSGYNGRKLWERRLPDGYLVHRSAFIATAEVFYMIDKDTCLMLDAETGVEKGRIRVPGTEGGWKWMAMVDHVLFVLSGRKEPLKTKRIASGKDHWSWWEIGDGLVRGDRIPWGFGKTFAAYDMAKNKRLWIHTEPKPVDSRAVGMRDGRLYFFAPESRIGCLDAADGTMVWTNTKPDVLKLIEEKETKAKRMTGLPGWRTERNLLCTPKALIFQAQQLPNVVGVSSQDGRFLWKRAKTWKCRDVAFVNGNVVAGLGPQLGRMEMLDPLTGETVRKLGFMKHNCVRMTGTPRALFCRGDGLGRLDLATGKYTLNGAVRPGCNDGAIPAHGLLYLGPWLCDCNLSLIGTVTFCSAGDFKFDHIATEDEHLQVAPSNTQKIAALATDAKDWPTCRASNDRGAATGVTVPKTVSKQWISSPLSPLRLSAPTTSGGLLFFGGQDGKVRCIDAANGTLKWCYATAGPVRLPPTIWQGRAFAGSDDGYVYALEAATGRLLWRFRCSPTERRIMVYDFLRSNWPVTSGVIVHDGVAYAAAGLIDGDGTYVYALDARTGKIKWQNNSTGHFRTDMRQGVSVLGNLTVGRGRLWLAGGIGIAAAPFDLATGKCAPARGPAGKPWSDIPRGQEIGVFRDRYVVMGGRLLYSSPEPVVSSAWFGFFRLGDDGKERVPPVKPQERTSLPPAWDSESIALTADRYAALTCWPSATFETSLEELHTLEKDMKAKRTRWNIARANRKKAFEAFREKATWSKGDLRLHSLAMTANAVVAVCEQRDEKTKSTGWTLRALDRKTGQALWQHPLPSKPVMGGLAIDRAGRTIVTLNNGRVVAYGKTF